MLNMNNEDALAIIFPNSYDALIPELVTERLMASIPFASRYGSLPCGGFYYFKYGT